VTTSSSAAPKPGCLATAHRRQQWLEVTTCNERIEVALDAPATTPQTTTSTSMLRSCAASLRFAEPISARTPSMTTHLACRLAR
jgi:hypothetical protein